MKILVDVVSDKTNRYAYRRLDVRMVWNPNESEKYLGFARYLSKSLQTLGAKHAITVIKELSCMGTRRTIVVTPVTSVPKEIYGYVTPHLVNWPADKEYYIDAEIYTCSEENQDLILEDVSKLKRFIPDTEILLNAKQMSDMLEYDVI